jgi:hypothetical protein
VDVDYANGDKISGVLHTGKIHFAISFVQESQAFPGIQNFDFVLRYEHPLISRFSTGSSASVGVYTTRSSASSYFTFFRAVRGVTLRFVVCVLRWAVCGPQSAVCGVQFAVHNMR